MAKEEQTQQDVAPSIPAKKKGAIVKWLIIGIAGLVLIGGGLAGGLYYLKVLAPGHQDSKGESLKETLLWPMEPFIVNLADNSGERYLKAVVQLEVSEQENATVMDSLKPKFRDCVLDILTAKSATELMDLNGKQRLRDDIASRLNKYLPKGRIVRVYFTEFVIQ